MSKKIIFFALILLSAAVFTSCNTSSVQSEIQYINYQERLSDLTRKLIELNKSGKTEDMKTLLKQLDTMKCDVNIGLTGSSEIKAEDIFNEKKDAVVIVGKLYKCGKCTKPHATTASGFFANDSGIVVTNYHVVNNEQTFAMGVMTYDGEVLPVKKVLAANKVDDVAVIQVENKTKTPFLEIQPKVNVGIKVWVISHPSKRFYMFTEGIVSALFERSINHQQKVKNILITADFGGGSSGAPVLNEKGEVIGIVASTEPVQPEKCKDQNYAQMVMKNCVPAESIKKLFD